VWNHEVQAHWPQALVLLFAAAATAREIMDAASKKASSW
jgi:hypothetical protein